MNKKSHWFFSDYAKAQDVFGVFGHGEEGF